MGYNYDSIALFLVYSALVGFLLGFVYDFFRAVRILSAASGKRFSEIVTYICDILFFVCCAVVCSIFIFHYNNGRIRGIAIAVSFVGFIIYLKTLGKFIVAVNTFVFRLIKRLICFIYRRIVKSIFAITVKAVLKIAGGIVKINNYLFTRREMFRIISMMKKI